MHMFIIIVVIGSSLLYSIRFLSISSDRACVHEEVTRARFRWMKSSYSGNVLHVECVFLWWIYIPLAIYFTITVLTVLHLTPQYRSVLIFDPRHMSILHQHFLVSSERLVPQQKYPTTSRSSIFQFRQTATAIPMILSCSPYYIHEFKKKDAATGINSVCVIVDSIINKRQVY